MRKHETISTKKFVFLIVTLWIRENPYFIIFHAVLNFICCGSPKNAFVISTSNFFPKPIIYYFYIAQNIDSSLHFKSDVKHLHRPLHLFLHPHLTSSLHRFETCGRSVHNRIISFSTFFTIQGYSKPYRFDRNRNGGGVFIYVREDIPGRELKIHDAPKDIESMFIEINLIKSKWLFLWLLSPT